jgi:hypothetical protein
MPDMTGSGRCGASSGSWGSRRDVKDFVARGQRLVDGPRPTGEEALAWHIQAYFLGDFAATAAAALRERTPR